MKALHIARLVSVLAVLSGAASTARAEATAEERAAAQVLFDQGKTLAQSGKFAEACPKFAESQRLDPRIATQFKLADCYEQLGMTASAWTNFVDVVAQTKTAGQKDRQAVAQKRADALAKKLSRVTVEVPESARVKDLEIKRNGTLVGSGMWGTPIPVDPGEHTFSASAPSKKTWESTITVKKGTREIKIEIPALEDAPTPPQGASAGVDSNGSSTVSSQAGVGADVPPPVIRGTAQRTAGYTIGALGLALVGVGGFFGVQAKEKNEESLQNCRTAQYCSQKGLDLNNEAKLAATISTVTFIGGGVLAATGILLVVLSPSSPKASKPVAIVPALGPSFQGAFVMGAF